MLLSRAISYASLIAFTTVVFFACKKQESNTVTNDTSTLDSNNAPVSVNIKYSGDRVAGDVISFTAGKAATTFLWEFGDGNTSAEESPTHVYNKAGEYMVKLSATTQEGGSLEGKMALTIMKDPVYTSKMTGERTWHVTVTEINERLGTDTSYQRVDEQFALEFIDKIEVAFPQGAYIEGNMLYNNAASSGNVLVFTKYPHTSPDTLYYDHVADTTYVKAVRYTKYQPGAKGPDYQQPTIIEMRTP